MSMPATKMTAAENKWTERDSAQRVVVTGLGAVIPLGSLVAQFWDGIAAGRSGLGPITRFRTDAYPFRVVGAVPDFDPRRSIDSPCMSRERRMRRVVT